MRIIVKPLGFVALAAVVVAGAALWRLTARPTLLREADWAFLRSDDVPAGSQLIDDPAGGVSVRRFTIGAVGAHPWSASWVNNLTRTELPAGQALTVRFRARSRSRSQLTVRLQSSKPPYPASLDKTVTLKPDWVDYSVSGRSPGYPAGGSQVVFYLSQSTGEIDLIDVRLEAR